MELNLYFNTPNAKADWEPIKVYSGPISYRTENIKIVFCAINVALFATIAKQAQPKEATVDLSGQQMTTAVGLGEHSLKCLLLD